MNLYHISQSINGYYDTYSDAVVAAETEEEARNIHPSGDKERWTGFPCSRVEDSPPDWASRENVTVKLIGFAAPFTEAGVICASFLAR